MDFCVPLALPVRGQAELNTGRPSGTRSFPKHILKKPPSQISMFNTLPKFAATLPLRHHETSLRAANDKIHRIVSHFGGEIAGKLRAECEPAATKLGNYAQKSGTPIVATKLRRNANAGRQRSSAQCRECERGNALRQNSSRAQKGKQDATDHGQPTTDNFTSPATSVSRTQTSNGVAND